MFTLNRIRFQPDRFQGGWMFRGIDQMEAPDRKTVRIRLKEPNYLFLRYLCSITTAIVPEDVVRRDESGFAKAPVGTGPFQLVSHNEGKCVLEAFPAHFRGRAHLDRVEVLILPQVEAGRLKEPDWTSLMMSHGETSSASRKALLNGGEEWHNLEAQFTCCSLLVFNQKKSGPHNHPLFREALHHILDRDALIAELGGDRICSARGFRPGAALSEKESACLPKRSRSEILALLERSGYREETLELVTNSYLEADARWIRERAASFGVTLEIRILSTAEWTDHASLQQSDCQLYGVVLGGDEVRELEVYLQNNYFSSLWDSRTAEVVEQEAAAILREAEETERRARLAELEQWIRQAHAVLFLVHKTTNTAFHQSVRGVGINSYGWVDFHNIWFNPSVS